MSLTAAKLKGKELEGALAFTSRIYKLHKAEARLTIKGEGKSEDVADRL